MSRTGRAWKRLEEIEELASLFPARRDTARPRPRVRRATPDLGLSQRPPPPTARDSSGRASDPPPPPAKAAASVSAPPSSAAPPGPGVSAPPAAAASPGPASAPQAPAAGARPPPTAPAQAASTDEAASAPAAGAPFGAQTASSADESAITGRMERLAPDSELDHSEALARRSSQPLRWLAILLPLVFAAWAVSRFVGERSAEQPRPDAVPAQLGHAMAILDAHRTSAFGDAIEAFERALARHPDDPHVLSGLSRVYAVWSQDLRFQLQDLPAAKRASAPQAAESKRLAGLAKVHAERAAQRNPGHEQAGVALADALRLSGNLVGARAELDRVRANEGVPETETLRVAALLAADEAGGDLSVGRSLAEQAVAQDPKLIRARELLARCLIAEGDPEGARLHMDAIAKTDPDHPVLARLTAVMAHPPEPEPAPEPASAETTTPRTRSKAKPAKGRAKDDEEGDLDALVASGEAALERGAVAQASRAFQHALAIDSSSARARTGLGYVALERGQPSQAIRRFRPAVAQGHPEAYIGLGDAYRRLGRMREALGVYKRYLKRFPKGPARSIAKRQVELLEEQVAETSSLTGDGARSPGEPR